MLGPRDEQREEGFGPKGVEVYAKKEEGRGGQAVSIPRWAEGLDEVGLAWAGTAGEGPCPFTHLPIHYEHIWGFSGNNCIFTSFKGPFVILGSAHIDALSGQAEPAYCPGDLLRGGV